MKERLKKLLQAKNEQRDALNKQLVESDSKEERAAIGETLKNLASEIAEVENLIADVDKPAENNDSVEGERKSKILGTSTRTANTDAEDVYSSISYRKAFQNYMFTGQMSKELRANASTTTTDAKAVIPTNLVNKIIEKYEQLGTIYNLVTKTNYAVGQTIPVDGVKPVATWVSEGSTSDAQKKTMGASITFTHHKLRCEIRYSEEVSTMTLPQFEAMFVRQVGEAMLRATEGAIVDGDGSGKPKGILSYTAPEGQALTIVAGTTGKLTYQTLCDMEAAVPVQYEGTAKWLMTKKQFMQFVGMTDTAGQPVARVNYGIAGKPERTLLGRDVVIYAPQANSKLGVYAATVTANTLIAAIVDFEDYVLNENYNLGIQHAQDWDNEDHKTKAVKACDGKMIIVDSLVTLTKLAASGS